MPLLSQVLLALLVSQALLVLPTLVQLDLPVLLMPAPAEVRCSRHPGLKTRASHRPYVSSARRS